MFEQIICLLMMHWQNQLRLMNNCINYYVERISRSRKRCSQLVLLFLILTTPPNNLLQVGPVLRINNRSIWMKKRSDDWWKTIVLQHFLDEDWLENFRMTADTHKWLCNQLRASLEPRNNAIQSREPLSVEKQVAVALYFLASCAEYRVVGNTFGIHKSTVYKCVHRVVDAINAELMGSCLNMPNEVECKEISFNYEKKTHIPQLLGAIDGTHIPILPPSDGYRDFVNRKGWPSIILQAVVDHAYRFRNINCKTPGSSHDAAVFCQSQLYKEHDRLIPTETKIVNGIEVPYMIMGDPAYPLLPWLLKGYTKTIRLSPEEESFNTYMNCGRVSVEIAFGRLKSRWRCLLKRLDVHYTYVPSIVSACCILHNIVETRNETFKAQWETAVNEAEFCYPQPCSNNDRHCDNFNANQNRNALKAYLGANFPLRKTFIH